MMQNKMKKAGNLFFESIEEDIKNKENFVQEQTRKGKEIHDSFNLLFEYRTVLKKAQKILMYRGRGLVDDNVALGSLNNEENKGYENEQLLQGPDGGIHVGHIAGTINKEEELRFKKLIFRATRGNALTYFDEFKGPIRDYYGHTTQKSVYVVIFQEGGSIREKIIRICDSFLGERFDIPPGGINDKINEINAKINDTRNVMATTNDEVKKYLMSVNHTEHSDASAIQLYKWFVIKEKALYENLNKLKKGDKLLVGLFWCPVSQTKFISDEVQRIKENRNISGPQMWKRENHGISPPTYFKTNEFTETFQEIINTYGVPDYKEVNPAVFTIITFPFLYAVMFGDIAHGLVLFLFGSFMCLMAEQLKNSPLGALVSARYLITMLGFFSTFIGVCYNDFASLPIDAGGCTYEDTINDVKIYKFKDDCIRIIGVEPGWYEAENLLEFLNGMKMKIAVIFGVSQMCLGIFMKAFNAIHFSKQLDFWFEFLPQITLMLSLFGWMDFLIIVKWLKPDWDVSTDPNVYQEDDKAASAPSIITVMINMFLSFGAVADEEDPIIGGESGQQTISIILLVISLICIPTMLFGKF